MNTKIKQSGSSHLIIIILLALALLGSLGYIFWQNFYTNKNNTGLPVDASEQVAEEKTVTVGKNLSKRFTLSYPDDWTVEDNSLDGNAIENISIYSPSRSVYVNYISEFDNSSGFVCGNDFENQTYESFNSTVLTSMPELSYRETTVKYIGEGYFYTAYLSESSTPIKAPTDNYCALYGLNLYDRESIPAEGNQAPRVAWRAQIKSSVLMSGSDQALKYTDTVSELNDFLSSDEFQVAKAILISAKPVE